MLYNTTYMWNLKKRVKFIEAERRRKWKLGAIRLSAQTFR